jgi:hypothetical protein
VVREGGNEHGSSIRYLCSEAPVLSELKVCTHFI